MPDRNRPLSTVANMVALALVATMGGCAWSASASSSSDAQASLQDFEDPSREAWSMPDKVVGALALSGAPLEIVDLGAGSGYFTRRLAQQNPKGRVLALDVDSRFRQYIEEHKVQWGTPNIETRLVVDSNPLLPDSSIDLVFLSNTYRFLPDRRAYFQSLFPSLKPGGRVAVIEFRTNADCSAIAECPENDTRIPKETAIQEMKDAGFELDAEHGFLPYQYYVVFKKPDSVSPDSTSVSGATQFRPQP